MFTLPIMMSSGVVEAGLSFIASVSHNYFESNSVDFDLSSTGISNGDLVLVTYGDDGGNSTMTTNCTGMADYNEIRVQANAASVYYGAYYGFWNSGTDSTTLTISSTNGISWTNGGMGVSIFRGVNSYVSYNVTGGISGMPNPPNLNADGELWIAVGHLDDDRITMTPPSGYTTMYDEISPGVGFSTHAAYKIESLSSEDPGIFTGSGSDGWSSMTIAFD